MLKALVVDDEDMTRDVLLNYLPWDEIGINKVLEANNGLNALEIIEHYHPDIVLCDVRMPKMDGIEFSIRLNEVLPDCKIVFLSSYSDKEYLLAAIKLKVIRYIEKPLNLEEIAGVLKLAATECIESNNKRIQQRQILLQNLCQSFTTGLYDVHQVGEFLIELAIHFPENGEYLSCIIRTYPVENENMESCTQSVLSSLHSLFESLNNEIIAAIKGESDIICFFRTDNRLSIDSLQIKLQELLDSFDEPTKFVSCKIYIGLGYKAIGLKNIHLSYQSAAAALRKQFFYGYNKMVTYSPDSSTVFQFDETILQTLSEQLRSHRPTEASLTIMSLVSQMKSHTNSEPDLIREAIYKLFLVISKFAENRNISLQTEKSAYQLNKIATTRTLSELKSYLLEVLQFVFQNAESKKHDQDTIAKITHIANEQFQDHELSIQSISKKLYLTPNYVSSTFKNATGKTITQYITDLRIQRAMELLKTTDYKLYDIGRLVGYVDGKYFTKVFEKAIGLKPKEYRGYRNHD
jgi:two-component system response regulator YesN